MSLIDTNLIDGVYDVHMRDVDAKNALSEAFVHELLDAMDDVTRDSRARVILLRGLPDVFCAGASKEMLRALARGEVLPHEIRLAGALLDVGLPMISAMEGHAVGGGFAVGLCADIVVMAEDSRYGCNFVDLGFTPGMGTTRLLEHVLSPAVAHELLYTGELRRGRQFTGGGINYVLPREQVQPKAEALAMRIAEKPRLVLETLKRTLSMGRRAAFEEGRTLEALMHTISLGRDGVGDDIEGRYVE